jgi:hypothetical protein
MKEGKPIEAKRNGEMQPCQASRRDNLVRTPNAQGRCKKQNNDPRSFEPTGEWKSIEVPDNLRMLPHQSQKLGSHSQM